MSGAAGGKRARRRGRSDVFFPEELSTEIMCKLPTAASIARFRCVSKSWNRLLTEFITGIIFSNDHPAQDRIARRSDPGSWPRLVSGIVGIESFFCGDEAASAGVMITGCPRIGRKDSWHSIVHHSNEMTRPVSLPEVPYALRFVGCSGGIICIDSSRYSTNENILLWNPTTSQTKVLPLLPRLLGRGPRGGADKHSAAIAFGFDPVRNDYKVLISVWIGLETEQFYVYSLREHSYGRIKGLELEPASDQLGRPIPCSASRTEKCRWFARPLGYHHDTQTYQLTCFDMSSEAFTQLQLPLPPELQYISPHTLHMSATKDGGPTTTCLVVAWSGVRPNRPARNFLDVWAVLDYERECSWIRLYNVEDLSSVHVAAPGRLLGLWKLPGKLFARCRSGFRVIDLDRTGGEDEDKDKVVHVDDKIGKYDDVDVVTYVPSTISFSRLTRRQPCRVRDQLRV